MTMPCDQTYRITALEQRDEVMLKEFKEVSQKFDGKLDTILFQLGKIAVLEVNHQNHSSSMERAFSKLGELEKECSELRGFKSHTEGMAKMAWLLWGSLGTGVVTLLVKVFFVGHS